jgi:poly(A) polymerase
MIITPAFPSMNSTYNVTQQTKQILLTEFEKAAMITRELNENRDHCEITWKRLFKKFPFF